MRRVQSPASYSPVRRGCGATPERSTEPAHDEPLVRAPRVVAGRKTSGSSTLSETARRSWVKRTE
ncbi:MAG: hypothetical protein AAF333_02045 [Planctomycetota bacterium]